MTDQQVNLLVDDLFRRESGRLVSTLARLFGPGRIDLAEDVAQDTLTKALRQWPYRGVPDNPSAWLFRVAKNRAIDLLRAEDLRRRKDDELSRWIERTESQVVEAFSEAEIPDDQLRMIFLCCHPQLAQEAQVALILKLLCGFSVAELAHGLRVKEAAIAQRLVRAKRTIRESGLSLDLPHENLSARLETVLHVLYLLFNKGYAASSGPDLVSRSLCDDAIYLASLIAEHPAGDLPLVHALLALMFFQSSRLPARTDSSGDLLLLAEQDRGLWDRRRIQRGCAHLQCAMRGDSLTRFHLEAGIASCHAAAPSYEATDWQAVVELYDHLFALTGSAIVGLNRAVAIAMLRGPAEGLKELESLRSHSALEGYYLLPATYGYLYAQLGECAEARVHYESALCCACSDPERRFIERRLAALSE